MVTTLTFYGGVNEIGGNKVLLKDEDTKVFLDFGISFTLRGQYYSTPFLAPRSEKGLREFGILPDIEGLYKFDKTSESRFDGVFLSHSHIDHTGYISFLKEDVPVYCGETTATILRTLNRIRPRDFEFNIDHVKFKTFRTGDRIQLGSLEVEPVHVDHSVPGSYGFIIHTSSGPVVYTGDFRSHGLKPDLTRDFVEKASEEKPIAVISEGTNMTGVHISSESEVRRKIGMIVKQTSGLVLANFACADIDRLHSFYEVAKDNDRYLAVTLKQAYLMDKLSKDPHLKVPNLSDGNILVFQKSKKTYYRWERRAMELGKPIDSSKIAELQDRIILVVSFYDLEELTEIKPVPGSCYILSASEPFNEEMEIDFNKLVNWLEHYGLPQYHTHVSGHITPLQLRSILRTISPKKIFPIHTTHPELFKKFMGDLESDILMPEKGRDYVVS